jgi:hypothetical protein
MCIGCKYIETKSLISIRGEIRLYGLLKLTQQQKHGNGRYILPPWLEDNLEKTVSYILSSWVPNTKRNNMYFSSLILRKRGGDNMLKLTAQKPHRICE